MTPNEPRHSPPSSTTTPPATTGRSSAPAFHRVVQSSIFRLHRTRTSSPTMPESRSPVPAERIERAILLLRGQRVILDHDLANLYMVESRALVQAVTRNLERFPSDFMFQLTANEWSALRSQTVISKGRGGRRYPPYCLHRAGRRGRGVQRCQNHGHLFLRSASRGQYSLLQGQRVILDHDLANRYRVFDLGKQVRLHSRQPNACAPLRQSIALDEGGAFDLEENGA